MFLNTKKQGDWGLGQAIAYFTSIGWTVALPLTDSQDYDIIVDNGNQLLRVQVKTTTFKQRGVNYFVSLTTKGGNQSFNTIKSFDHNTVDYIFVITGDNDRYFIPSDVVGNSISLGKLYDKYLL